MIELDAVGKRYPDGTVAVESLSLDLADGEITVFIGPSGCGKTTALRLVNRMVDPTSGTVRIDGRDVTTIAPHDLRRGIGYVIQQVGLFPHKTILDNITTVPRLLGWDKARARGRAVELLELVGLPSAVATRYPAQLSGGQQQRVGVARALAADPPVLLMDEPFGAVDPIVRQQLQVEFARLQRELKKTIVFVTHDIDEAVFLGDRVAVLGVGAAVHQFAAPAEMLLRPADEFVASFLGSDRGLKRLGLLRADRAATSMNPQRADGEWQVVLAEDGRPAGWRSRRSGPSQPLVPLDAVGPQATARTLLDAVLSSPARLAVRVDDAGRFVGVVDYGAVQALLAESDGIEP